MADLALERFHDPKVRAILDALDTATLTDRLGEPHREVMYAQGKGYWIVGSGKPILADDDPAVMQAIGRCMTWRVRSHLPVPMPALDGVHPAPCPWDEYPDRLLLEACDWATWHSRWVSVELLVWSSEHDGQRAIYAREARAGVYENPVWRDFFALPWQERRTRVEDAMREAA